MLKKKKKDSEELAGNPFGNLATFLLLTNTHIQVVTVHGGMKCFHKALTEPFHYSHETLY